MQVYWHDGNVLGRRPVYGNKPALRAALQRFVRNNPTTGDRAAEGFDVAIIRYVPRSITRMARIYRYFSGGIHRSRTDGRNHLTVMYLRTRRGTWRKEHLYPSNGMLRRAGIRR